MSNKIEKVDYGLLDDDTYFGYTVVTEAPNVMGQIEWNCEGTEYYQPVIDFLNRDYYSFTEDEIIFDGESGIKVYKWLDKGNIEILPAPAKSIVDANVKMVINDLSELEQVAIRELIDSVLLVDTIPYKTTCSQRFFACYMSNFASSRHLLNYFSESRMGATITKNEKAKHLGNTKDEKDYYQELTDNESKFNYLCKELSENKNPAHLISYNIFNSLSDMIRFIIGNMIRQNIGIKRCKNCGKYFVPNRSNATFCSNPSPKDNSKSCKEYAKYAKSLEKARNDEATRLYRQIYNAMNNKARRCRTAENPKGNKRLEVKLTKFKAESTMYREGIKTNKKTKEEYVLWLNEYKRSNENTGEGT